MVLEIVCAGLGTAAAVLGIKVYLMRKSARELRTSLAWKLHEDTNTVLTISSGDRELRALADAWNHELVELQKQRHSYVNGDRELKEAATNISHDLRTPITAIQGYLELLEKEEKSEKVQRYLDAIQNRTDAMKELTEELFHYSVLLSEDRKLTLKTISLTGALEEAVAGMYGIFTARGIVPQIMMPEETVYCRADKEALMRILNNILNNAWKYSEGDLRISLSERGEIRFSNETAGLTAVEVGRIFHRFYTVDSSRKSTGLGLSIAKYLAEEMGVDLSADYDGQKLTLILKMMPVSKIAK